MLCQLRLTVITTLNSKNSVVTPPFHCACQTALYNRQVTNTIILLKPRHFFYHQIPRVELELKWQHSFHPYHS